MNLEVPRFDGSNAPAWIFKISQFFDYHRTPDDERIQVASFYLDGAALSWFQWMHRNDQLPSWSSFLQAQELRFAPSLYDDPRGALFKLSQHGSVNSYLAEFEALANRIVGLPTPFLLSCFISGLAPDIRREVLALQPLSLSQAAALARLQKDKFTDARRHHRPRPPPLSTLPPSSPPLASLPPISSTPTNNLPPLLPTPPKTTYKRLTQAEMASRRERGLCYNCDERYGPNHRCRGKFFLLIASEDDDHPPGPPDPPTPPSPLPSPTDQPPTPLSAQLSLHALSGQPASATLRVLGLITGHDVVVLVDGGSTQYFIHDRLAHFLHLVTLPVPPLTIMVGNGSEITYDRVCRDTTIAIQGHTFTLDLHVMPLGGTDVVLGVAWLQLLGPITIDYSHLQMTFVHHGRPITIQGGVDIGPSEIHHGQVRRLMATQRVAALFHIHLQEPGPI